MSLFKIPRTSQPQGPVGIDWSNPLSKGLVIASVATDGFAYNLAGAQPITRVTAGVTLNKSGRAVRFAGSTSELVKYPTALPNGDLSYLAIITPASLAANMIVFGSFNVPAAADISNYISIESGGKFCAVSTAVNDWDLAVGETATVGKIQTALGVFKRGGGRSIYVDGRLSGSSAVARSPSLLNVDAIGIYLTQTNLQQSPANGSISLVLKWSRALSHKEACSISANPWQIFQPIDINPQFDLIKPKVYVPNTYFTKRSSMMLGTSVGQVENVTGVLGIKRVCSKQPQGIVEIDWSNSLTKDLSICFTPHKGANLVSGRNLTIAFPVSFGYDMHGKYLSGGIYRQNDINGISIAESSALVVCFDISPQNWNAAFGVSTGSNSDTHSIGLFSGSSTNGPFLSFVNGAGGAVANNYTPGWSVGPHVVATSKSNAAGLLNIWMDGKQEAKDAGYVPAGSNTYPAFDIVGDGKVKNYLTLFWNRVLSAKELSTLTKNPWQIFKPHVADIWMPLNPCLSTIRSNK